MRTVRPATTKVVCYETGVAKSKPRAQPWNVEFLARHPDDDPEETVPAREFLDECPANVAARLLAVVQAVADAPKRTHYRLFCLLERDGVSVGLNGPSVVLITGMVKPFLTTFSKKDYARVRELGDEYKRRKPRSVAR